MGHMVQSATCTYIIDSINFLFMRTSWLLKQFVWEYRLHWYGNSHMSCVSPLQTFACYSLVVCYIFGITSVVAVNCWNTFQRWKKFHTATLLTGKSWEQSEPTQSSNGSYAVFFTICANILWDLARPTVYVVVDSTSWFPLLYKCRTVFCVFSLP